MRQNQLLRVLGIGLLSAWFMLVPDGHSGWVIWPCLVIFYAVALPAFRPIEVKHGLKTQLAARPLFYLYVYLLFFYPYQLHVLGLYDLEGNQFLKASFIEKSNASILLSMIAVLSFDVGCLQTIQRPRKDPNSGAYGLVPWILAGGLLSVFAFYCISGLPAALVGAYAGSTTGNTTSDGIYFLCTAFSMWTAGAFIFYISSRKKVPPPIWVGIAVAAAWSMILLVLGDRNNFFLIALVLAAGYATFVRRVPLMALALAVLAALFVYNVVEVARTSEDRSLQAIQQAAGSIRESSGGIERGSFGITTTTGRAALDIAENKTGYFYGKLKLIGFAGIIPYSRSLFVDTNDRFQASSKIFTYWMVGPYATWGVGSNVISDAYMDFGLPGVIIFMFLLGLFAKYAQIKVQENIDSMKWVTIYLVMVATFAEMARYTVDFPVRCIVWAFFVFYAGAKLRRMRW